MKKLSLGKVKLASEELMERDQMALIYGGSGCGSSLSVFHCYCGSDQTNKFTVLAETIEDALDYTLTPNSCSIDPGNTPTCEMVN